MHQDNEVSVFAQGLRGQGESPAGVGWLMTPNVVVMRQPGCGATPGLPSHVAVPAVSGGGRDDDRVPVLGVYDSTDLPGWVALQLDRDCEVPGTGTPPAGIDLSGLSVSDLSRSTPDQESALLGDGSLSAIDDQIVMASSWLCRCFPSLPGCRR